MHEEIIKYRDNQVIPEREVAGMSLKGLEMGNRLFCIQTVSRSTWANHSRGHSPTTNRL